jgi:hypothetical protein
MREKVGFGRATGLDCENVGIKESGIDREKFIVWLLTKHHPTSKTILGTWLIGKGYLRKRLKAILGYWLGVVQLICTVLRPVQTLTSRSRIPFSCLAESLPF